MEVAITNGRLLDALDDTVTVIVPDGPDSLKEVVLGDPAALAFYLDAARIAPLEVTCVAADCRQGLLPARFTGHYVGLTDAIGEFEDAGTAFEFLPDHDDDTIALPFGWLMTVRIAA